MTKQITGNVSTNDVSNIDGFASAQKVFASQFTIGGVSIRITLVWWILFVAVATWVLLRTHIGNWIFAVGGSAPSSRAVGVPVNRVKIGLFMAVGLLGRCTGKHTLFALHTLQSGVRGGHQLIYLLAATARGRPLPRRRGRG